MVSRTIFCLSAFLVLSVLATSASSSKILSPYYYNHVCPKALPTIKRVVEAAVYKERRMGASLLRLHFHDCFVNLGGPTWAVQLGRKDSTTASRDKANNDLPSPFMDLPALINSFKRQGLNERDLVALSGGHTLGSAQCFTFRNRTHNDTNIDPKFAKQRKSTCPLVGGDSNLAPLDPTPARFDVAYFNGLVKKRGLLHSDQALFNGGSTDGLVKAYSSNAKAFWADFAKSMVKMGNINILTGKQGQVRLNCRKVN
ncbi:hypothetical protein POTOM_053072 [Populus tomentosa]|uniref:peroxidase n=1 Tax=Populus tomentosa TaxID=118781 RepID=A0A8X8C7X5_POPTO|nr:hypothetical protein POTOM_053072 [Populus tomentosa]